MTESQLVLGLEAQQTPSRAPDPDGQHGEVFTRRWVVDLILDAVGYRSNLDLGSQTIVEPSCGCGAFMVPIVERLTESCVQRGKSLGECEQAIRGFDLLEHNAEFTRRAIVAKLLRAWRDTRDSRASL